MQVIRLFTKQQQGGPVVEQDQLMLRYGYGIEGDRSSIEGSPRQVLLVSAAVLTNFDLQPGDLQENFLVDEPVEALNSGQVLQIGRSALVRLTYRCEPCSYLETLKPGLAGQIRGKRGRLGMVVRDGLVQAGDRLTLTDYQFPVLPDDAKGRFAEFVARIPSGKVVRTAALLLALGLTRGYYRMIPRLMKAAIDLPVHRIVTIDGSLMTAHLPDQAHNLQQEGVEIVNHQVSLDYCWRSSDFHDLKVKGWRVCLKIRKPFDVPFPPYDREEISSCSMTIIWELDFYSRPVVDEQQKKLWEVLICESPLDIRTRPDSLFRYAQFCTSTEVNSVWLKTALTEAIAQAPKPPDKIRFFRRQMNNMIVKGCQDAGVPAYASRRTIAIQEWLKQRMQSVYPAHPNYQPGSSNASVSLPTPAPQPLPDALIGQKWAFVTLEASAFADLPEWEIAFGEAFPLELVGVTPDMQIPGVIIFSPRALPLAGWMSGLDLSFLKFDPYMPPARLVIETGVTDSWILANLNTPQLQTEAQNFERAKQQAHQVHFFAVQSDPQAEAFAGFWLLQELNLT
jgi:alkylated DNA nucleotide flippase Atl1